MNNLTANPFVSTPFSPESESMQRLPLSIPNEPNAMQPAPDPKQPDELENLYPEIYWEVHPLIADVVDKMIAGGYNPTPEAIGTIVDNVIKNSGLWYEDEDGDRYDMNPEAVPVQLGFGRMPFRRRRRRHHNRDTLRDIIRILLLRELLGRRHDFPYRGY